jgi:hypothetical protein
MAGNPSVEELAEFAKEKMKALNWRQKRKLLRTVRFYARLCGVRGEELEVFLRQLGLK